MKHAVRNMLLSGGPGWVFSGASLDLDFANSRYYQQGVGSSLSSLVSCTRSSAAYIDDLSGTWKQVASNTLRSSNKGALIEGASTNAIRNNSMQGGSAPSTLPTNWTPSATSGLTPTYAYGTESGIDYIDIILSGTSTGGNNNLAMEASQIIAALNAQTWAPSAFIKIQAGTTANLTNVILRTQMQDSSGSSLGSLDITTLAASIGSTALGLNRITGSVTLNQASTAYVRPFLLITTAAGAVSVTIRVGWPQWENSPFATSPIRTTNAAATRAADAVSLNTVPANLAAGFSLYGAYSTYPPTGSTATNRTLLSLSDGTNNNRGELIENTTDKALAVLVAGSTSVGPSYFGSTLAANTTHKMALAWQSGDFAAAVDGGSLQTNTTAGTMGAALSQINIGSHLGTGVFANSYLSRIALFPARIPNATLTQITT